MTSWISSTPDTVFRDVCRASASTPRFAFLSHEPVVIVVPTSRQRDDVLMQWARSNGRGEPPTVLTMAALYRALAPQVLEQIPRILPDSSVDVLLAYAAEACDLPPGSIRLRASRIVRWAQELRSPAWLRDAALRHPSQRAARQLATAARIWEAYEDVLGSRAADRGTFSRRVIEQIRSRPSIVLTTPSGDAITRCLVVDTHGVTGVDADFLHALSERGWDIAVQFAPEMPQREEALASRTERDVQWFVAHGWHEGGRYEAGLPEVERTLVACTSRSDEVRRAVALCKEAAAVGVSLNAMAICVPGDQLYVERLRQACVESGLPLRTTSEQSLAQTHTASLLHACCRVVAGAWVRADVERVLREPLLRDLVHNGPALLLIAREERIVGGNGAQEWIDRLEQRRADMQTIAERNDDDDEHAERNVRRYEYALRTLRELRSLLDVQVHGALDVERFTSILLTRLAGAIDLERRCMEHEPRAFAALRDACSAYMALHRDHDLPAWSFTMHLHRWWTIVRSTMIATASPTRSGVRVVRPAELRGDAIDLVVVVGCLEGEFPRTTTHQLDEDVVPDVQKHLAWESMADIALAVAPGGTMVCTYPSILDGSPVLASTTLDAFGDGITQRSRWRSANPAIACVVHPRDQRVAYDDAPVMDMSQLGRVGLLMHDEAQRILEEDLSRPISPSRLDVAIQCPYRFFAQYIVRLDDIDYDDVRLTPLERGTLLHDVVDRWYQRMRGDSSVEMSPAGLRAARVDLQGTTFDEQWSLLQRTVDDVLAEQSHVHAFAPVERRALLGDDLRPGLLKRWLALEREDQRTSGFMPVLFEQEIEISIDITLNDGVVSVPVKTRIDRIDLREVDGVLHVAVVDYKSSLAESFTKTKVQKGRASQMPLYLAAVRAWFAQHGVDVVPEAAVYRAFGSSLQSPSKLDRRVVLADVGSPMASLGKSREATVRTPLSETLQDVLALLYPGVAQIQSGTYPVRPLKDVCTMCRVSSVCRKDHWGMLVSTTEEEAHHDEEGYVSTRTRTR